MGIKTKALFSFCSNVDVASKKLQALCGALTELEKSIDAEVVRQKAVADSIRAQKGNLSIFCLVFSANSMI